MAAPIFGKDWYRKPPLQHKEASDKFRAAVVSARSGQDEAARQVYDSFLQRSSRRSVVETLEAAVAVGFHTL